MSNKANERATEQKRVDEVIHEINQKAQELYAKSKGIKESVIELRKTFWDDVTVNIDEPDDIIETEASIKQQAELLTQKESAHGKLDQQLKILIRLKDSPYFGRIDFIEEGLSEKEAIYIGVASLMDRNDEDFLVYDWRAPISSLYYDFPPGKASYETVDSKIHGEIKLKRQFIIRQGKLKGMFDTGLTIGDQLLQNALGNTASTTMKSIVATIQQEQNKIIRNEKSDLLVVQGVAGSGKTSAALQRIAYLLYRYRKELNKDNVVMFSPNPLFSSYITNVLPELGEENVRQTTFLNYLRDRAVGNVEIESPFEQMEYVLTAKGNPDYEIRIENMNYKSSVEFKNHIDDYLLNLIQEGVHFKNITFQGRILISKEEIYEYFYSFDAEISIPNRVERVAKWLLHELRKHQKEEIYNDWVMEQAELLDKEDYLKAYYEEQKVDEDINLEEEILRKEIVKRVFSPIKKQVKRFQFVNVLATYYRLFTEWNGNKPIQWEKIANFTAKNITKRFLPWEDAAPYVYFQGKLIGDYSDRSVRHLFIDEAQDYSAFQFAYIRELFPHTRMTLLGDINQAIYANTSKENPLIPDTMVRKHERITLTKSYRSTRQIVEFTKYFAPGGEMIEPFNRDGDLPKLIIQEDQNLNDLLLANLEELRNKGNETIAIITKTLQESETIHERLREKTDIYLIDEETYTFQKGLLVLPVYLAKGIEFDGVIIPDASAKCYSEESDRTLFYTACTRAMHDLVMISDGEACKFIQETPSDTFEVINE
ncbi:RNA polymerase recycling motor HelD [Ornithinibacillus halophilus]|uniref:ATP-dependent DNA helicase, Rep family n=1 Tax=Ornithinibacillus halophilus TaxID=930117 RepID=A0A1M5DZQ5_9BACI|nr:RNA polymerase recycling motor HelD [Ornithinibacillus halophilus]SHF72420.1 ATP-dependent DNA helicase, Rep family [Ornithinibacillus halophilus]